MTDSGSDDEYLTLARESRAEIKVLASRFIAYARPVTTADAFDGFLAALKKEHHSATHHCHAWRRGFDDALFRYSDDGEPAGTAGKRILGVIDHHRLTDTGIVVVRYYGGTKLGTGGLARAYTDAAREAVLANTIESRFRTVVFRVTFPYDISRDIHHILETRGAEILDRSYLESTTYTVRIRASLSASLEAALRAEAHRGVRIG